MHIILINFVNLPSWRRVYQGPTLKLNVEFENCPCKMRHYELQLKGNRMPVKRDDKPIIKLIMSPKENFKNPMQKPLAGLPDRKAHATMKSICYLFQKCPAFNLK